MKRFFAFCSLLGCIFTLPFCLTACEHEIDYTKYLSENRSNIFIAEGEKCRLKIYAVDKEYPYLADGFVGEVTSRIEVYFSIQNAGNPCHLSILHNGQELGGEMSFDGVSKEYYFSCSADLSDAQTVEAKISHAANEISLSAKSVKNESTLSSFQIVDTLKNGASELFASLTTKENFEGEIYLRLLYENAPFYYVGIIDRAKKTTAFLLDAVDGKILASKCN